MRYTAGIGHVFLMPACDKQFLKVYTRLLAR